MSQLLYSFLDEPASSRFLFCVTMNFMKVEKRMIISQLFSDFWPPKLSKGNMLKTSGLGGGVCFTALSW